MILLVLATALAAIGATLFVSALGLERLTDLATAWCLAVPAVITAAGLLAGAALHSLRPGTLLLVTAALSVAAAATAAARRGSVRHTVAVLRRRLRRRTLRSHAAALARRPAVLVPLLLVIGVYGWRLLMALRLPPSDWDGLGYHLIAPDTWVQNGAITHVPYTTGELIWSDVYPQNGELIDAWSMTFLHNVRLVGLTPFLFAVLGAVSVAGLARNLGATRRLAVLAGLAFPLTPIAVAQMGTGYVDVMAAACLLAGLQLVLSPVSPTPGAAAVRGAATRPGPAFLAAGTAFGLAAGTKTTGLLAAALGLVLAVGVLAVADRHALHGWGRGGDGAAPAEPRRRPAGPEPAGPNPTAGPGMPGAATRLLTRRATPTPALATAVVPSAAGGAAVGASVGLRGAGVLRSGLWLRRLTGPLLCLLLPVLALSLYWYVRTWTAHGNPVYPYAILGLPGWGSVHALLVEQTPVQLAGEGTVEQVLSSWWHDVGGPGTAYGYDQRVGGLGPQWPLLLLPALVVGGVLALRRGRRVLLWGVLAPSAAILAACPVPWWSRFTLWLAGVGAVCLALALTWLVPGHGARDDRTRRTGRTRTLPRIRALPRISSRIGISDLGRIRGWGGRIATAALVGLLGLSAFWSVRRDAVVTNATVAASFGQTWHLMQESYTELNRTITPYNGYAALAALPRGSVIAVPNQLHPSFTHPYVGSYLERRLVMFDAPATPGELAARLRAAGAEYVVLSPAPPAPTRPGTAALTAAVQADAGQFTEIGRVRDGLLFHLVGGGG